MPVFPPVVIIGGVVVAAGAAAAAAAKAWSDDEEEEKNSSRNTSSKNQSSSTKSKTSSSNHRTNQRQRRLKRIKKERNREALKLAERYGLDLGNKESLKFHHFNPQRLIDRLEKEAEEKREKLYRPVKNLDDEIETLEDLRRDLRKLRRR